MTSTLLLMLMSGEQTLTTIWDCKTIQQGLMDRIHVLNFNQITFRVQPDVVESFRKENLNISKVCLQKFHTGFITKSGDVLTCGHGRGGRLGHGSETMQLAPKGSSLNYFPFVKLMSVHVSFLEMFRPKKCSSWFLNVIIPYFVH